MKELKPLVNLVNRRKALSMTQEQLAKKAKISRAMLSNIERGEAGASLQSAYRLARALDTTMEHLFFNQKARIMNKSA